jgi:hypothetical protein
MQFHKRQPKVRVATHGSQPADDIFDDDVMLPSGMMSTARAPKATQGKRNAKIGAAT